MLIVFLVLGYAATFTAGYAWCAAQDERVTYRVRAAR
jgi:hypothetical protein